MSASRAIVGDAVRFVAQVASGLGIPELIELSGESSDKQKKGKGF